MIGEMMEILEKGFMDGLGQGKVLKDNHEIAGMRTTWSEIGDGKKFWAQRMAREGVIQDEICQNREKQWRMFTSVDSTCLSFCG